jgi:hypothetical protein
VLAGLTSVELEAGAEVAVVVVTGAVDSLEGVL